MCVLLVDPNSSPSPDIAIVNASSAIPQVCCAVVLTPCQFASLDTESVLITRKCGTHEHVM